MKRQRAAWWAALPLLSVLLTSPAAGGGYTEVFDITGRVPAPDGGAGFLARAVPIRWDERCMPVPIRINDTLDPIPNPLGADFLTVADATAALDRSLAAWNAVPGTFLRLELSGTSSNPGLGRFDFVSEVVFRAPSFLAGFARTITHALMEDVWLEDGEDLDGDGDVDVVAGLDRCRDADGDGDYELPAGFYRAGTILDADVELNTEGFRFTVSDAAVDTDPHSVDLQAILTHELGHVHGLAHSLTNQIGADDGRPATLFALLDSGDPADELAWRRLSLEDMASTAFHYPEGSAATGPAALGSGEVPFDELYGVIEGEVRHSRTGLPLAGGSVFAEDAVTGRRLGSAVSGTIVNVLGPASGQRRRLPPEDAILDGRYRLPVPLGRYRVGIEPIDPEPIPASFVNQTALEGSVRGLMDFPEELYDRDGEGAMELSPGRGVPVPVRPTGDAARGIDLATEVQVRLAPFGVDDVFVSVDAPPGFYYAVRFPAAEVVEATGGGPFALVAGRFHTSLVDHSEVPVFEEALLTTGRLLTDGGAELDLDRPLRREAPFVGQDDDFASFFFKASAGLGDRVRELIAQGGVEQLFLVLRVPTTTPFPGVSGTPPLVASDRGAPGTRGRSYTSVDGEVFLPTVQDDFRFDLLLLTEDASDDE